MNSIIGWIGGKKRFRRLIENLVPSDIGGYIEVFGGAGWVLFYKDRWAELEVYNDLDKRLVNLFKIVKYHSNELGREMSLLPSSRTLFHELMRNEGLTDIQKAARFCYLIKRSFGCKGETFGTSRKSGGAGFASHKNLVELMGKLHIRLDRVVIENMDYQKLINIYDDNNNFFFMDPPYRYGQQYKVGKIDYVRLAKTIKNIKGKFLLTLDNCEENKKLFADYDIMEIERPNMLNNKNRKNAIYREIFIKNY